MTTSVIIDAVVVLVLAGFVLWGTRKGLLKSLAGLVIMIVALVGAGIVASAFVDPVTNLVAPMIENTISEQVSNVLEEVEFQLPEGAELQLPEGSEEALAVVEQLLSELGIDESLRQSLTEQVQETVLETGAGVVSAVVKTVARGIVYGILYILAFVLLTILLHVLVNAMNLVMKLPGLKSMNTLGGGLFGFLQGVLLLFLAVWVARKMGVSFETAALAEAHILRIFTTNTPLSVLSFLQ